MNAGNSWMHLDIIKDICEDFLRTDFPLPHNNIILSGGDPFLHPYFTDVVQLVRKLNNDRISLGTNGFLIPRYISILQKNDGVQVSIDGNEEIHDYIRGEGSYQKAVEALNLLQEHGIPHGIAFTTNRMNVECIDHIINLCVETGSSTLNCNVFQPIRKSSLQPISFTEWLKVREYAIKQTQKRRIHLTSSCIENGCIAGVLGLSVLTDGTYWDCTRNQETIGRYPQKIKEVLYWDHIKNESSRDQFGTCCRRLCYE
jgi:MoaA/NifB/PqqE/SkfB family radical SAM enzyme